MFSGHSEELNVKNADSALLLSLLFYLPRFKVCLASFYSLHKSFFFSTQLYIDSSDDSHISHVIPFVFEIDVATCTITGSVFCPSNRFTCYFVKLFSFVSNCGPICNFIF